MMINFREDVGLAEGLNCQHHVGSSSADNVQAFQYDLGTY